MTKTAHQLFIGYRRHDGGDAGRLYDRLAEAFSTGAVFVDRESLTPGQPYREELTEAIRSARVCLIVIGQHWLSEKNQPRLFDENDITRNEIRVALECAAAGDNYTVIVVLTGGASMPTENDLPPEIAKLRDGHAHTLEETRYAASVEALIETLTHKYGLKKTFGAGKPFHLIDQPLTEHYADPLGHLAELRQQLKKCGSAAVLAAATVQGMGGVGKTQLALKYSHSYRNEYHGIWWFRAESTALLDHDCAACCEQFEIKVPLGTLHRQALRDWLAQQPGWLLVYDNVEDARALQAYLPQSSKHHVLITSRLTQWDAAATLTLDVWSNEQALDFLCQRLPAADDEQHRALAQALGGLPLALEQACAYLDKTGVGVETYIVHIDNFNRQTPLLGRNDSDRCSRSVLATLSLAFDRLSEPARAMLHLCAWLAPEAIPEYLFTENAELLPKELATRVGDPLDWRETVAELTGYAMCQTSSDGSGSLGLLFHRLTQAAVQIQHRQQISEEAEQVLGLLRGAFPENTEHPDHWPNCMALAPHVRQFWAWHEKGVAIDTETLSWLLDRLASYFFSAHGLYGEAERLQRKALAINNELLGDEHANTLASMNNLAGTLKAQGNLTDARKFEEAALAVRCRVFGEEHQDTLTVMNNLAHTFWMQGDLSGARKLEETVLAARRRLLGDTHPATLTSMNSLAQTLSDQGALVDARELQETVLATRSHQLGKEHPDTLKAMSNLALTLRAQDDLASACRLEESVLTARRRLLGEEHPETLVSMSNLACTLAAQDDLVAARALDESVLAVRCRLLGDEHPDTLISMNNLAIVLSAQGKLTEARKLQESVLEARRRVLGEKHLDTIASALSLLVILSRLNERRPAEKLRQRYLLPLLKADPISLNADLKAIRQQLLQHKTHKR